jgi:hypothetical protein
MASIQGILVKLKTKSTSGGGTDDHIYIGFVGKGGGSEFPLDVKGFNDFEPGADVKYWFGDVWDGSELAGAKRPYAAGSGNDPGPRYIDMDQVDYVYLRKHSHKGGSDDDAWKMDRVEVNLFGAASPAKRTFYKTGDIWLANEHGQFAYLKEKAG